MAIRKPAQYRVEIPPGKDIEQMRDWCRKNLDGAVKVTYGRKHDSKRKKWVRDYNSTPMLRFREEGDALAFKLVWIEKVE